MENQAEPSIPQDGKSLYIHEGTGKGPEDPQLTGQRWESKGQEAN